MPSTAELVGYVAAVLTTLAFLPQLVKIVRSRSAKDVSLPTFVLMVTGVFMWLLYGILTLAWPVIVANAVTLGLSGAILVLKRRYG